MKRVAVILVVALLIWVLVLTLLVDASAGPALTPGSPSSTVADKARPPRVGGRTIPS